LTDALGPEYERKYGLTFAVLVLGMAAYALVQFLVIPVLPTIETDLHTDATGASWILTIYLLSASVFTPVMGRLGDMWGKRLFLLISLASLACGCSLSAAAHSLWLMLLGRAVQGAGRGTRPSVLRNHSRCVPSRQGGRWRAL
jgi:predicted MFS family arabinose efflux permease